MEKMKKYLAFLGYEIILVVAMVIIIIIGLVEIFIVKELSFGTGIVAIGTIMLIYVHPKKRKIQSSNL